MTQFLAITEGQITRILGPITNIIDVIVPALIGLVASVGAIWCIGIELVLVIASWIGIHFIVLKFFDKDGNRRPNVTFKKRT